jgi:hypothetical protein
MELTETDVRVLRTLSGQEVASLVGVQQLVQVWSSLRGAGYASKGYSKIEITDAGRAALQAQEKNDG